MTMYNLTETLDLPGSMSLTKTLNRIKVPRIKKRVMVKTPGKVKSTLVLFVVEKEHHGVYSKMRNFSCSTLETVAEDLELNHKQPDIILISSENLCTHPFSTYGSLFPDLFDSLPQYCIEVRL